MIITITVVENQDAEEWDVDRFHVSSDFRSIEATSEDKERAINHVKGTVLCTIGQFDTVPDKIEFVIRNGG